MQVTPVELEAVLKLNRLVADVTVVPIPDEMAGELPRAYVVKSPAAKELGDSEIQNELHALVNEKFPTYKRLAGGIGFVSAIPKTVSGKVRRSIMKQMAKDHYKATKKARELESVPASMQVFTYDTDEDGGDDE